MNSLNKQLKILNENGVTFAHIGNIASISRTTVSNYAREKTFISFEVEEKLREAVSIIKEAIANA